MQYRGCVAVVGIALGITAVIVLGSEVSGQSSEVSDRAEEAEGNAAEWQPPRTLDGKPDLQGVWSHDVATPLQRPAALAGRATLTDEEVTAMKAAVAEVLAEGGDAAFGDSVYEVALERIKGFKSADPGTGNYNQFWMGDRWFDNRTSLIIDPPDGRMPPSTAEARERSAARRAAAIAAGAAVSENGERVEGGGLGYSSYEDRTLSERCITWGVPQLLANYNSYYQIVQTPTYVVVEMEKIHDARIIPLDGRPYPDPAIRQWMGVSRGRWEGDTLVVETRNFGSQSGPSSKRVVERFTRTAPDRLEYEITQEDPATWTRPWTVSIPLRKTEEKMYEYACHEGNYALPGILAGARAAEREGRSTSK